VNGQISLAPSFGPSEARRLTDEVKRDAQALWRKLIELYEGGAHEALNYPSWHEYCKAEFGFGRSHSYRLLEAGRVAASIPQLGNEAQARELARLDGESEIVETWHELCDEYGERVTAGKIREAVERRLRLEQKVGALKSSESAEWYTPARYIAAARYVLGGIDLDPASSALANEVVGSTTYYGGAEDGLEQPWSGRVFLNPPYGNACASFVAKALSEYEAGRVEALILLLNAYSTDVSWFQRLWDHVLCFTDHRIDFYSPNGSGGNTTHGSVFVYLGSESEKFATAFRQFGRIVVDYFAREP
jgi:phage N-6-adenine-methyltransferase